MKIMVTGASGFVGKGLIARLLSENTLINGQKLSQLIVVDMDCSALPEDNRLIKVAGSIADDSILTQALKDEPELVFHLASLPGGAAEANYSLGLDVNLYAPINLFEKMRNFTKPAKLVFTSTIAVYGDSPLSVINDLSPMKPHLSYGAHKLATETLLQDYSRRGWIDGRIVRLPGIVARPSQASGLLSAYLSDIFWKLSAGEPFTCPVSSNAVSWFMSQTCCIDNLFHAAEITPEVIAPRRDFTLPVLRITMEELINALAKRFGDDRKALVSYEVNEKLEAGFGCQPPLESNEAEAVGYKNDGSIELLIDRALASI